MGKIVERAEEYWNFLHCGSHGTHRDNFVGLFKLIEAEFKVLGERMERFEKAKTIGEIAGVGQLESRIDALEECIKCVDALTPPDILMAKPKDLIEAPTDKHNNPPGGLELGDFISAAHSDPNGVWLGIYLYTKENPETNDIGERARVYGYWKDPENKYFSRGIGFFHKNDVRFEFRPKQREG